MVADFAYVTDSLTLILFVDFKLLAGEGQTCCLQVIG